MNKESALTYEFKAPAWLPENLRRRLKATGRLEYLGRFSEADRAVMRKRRPMPVSSWAEKHRVITMGALPGPWHNLTTPYLAGIMDAAGYDSVRTIILCKSPQIGGSETAHNFIGYCIDRDPGPALYIFPDQDTARENSQDRIIPMLQSSDRLRTYLTGTDDDLASIRIRLKHMPIYMAWARSAARLANKPIRYLIFDEIDKYPDTAGKKEADPISLGEKRCQTYRAMGKEKIWKISSPTMESGPIWQALTKEAEIIFDYWVKCPFCDESLLMEFDGIKWPRDDKGEHPDPERLETRKLAWYQCPRCEARWSDEHRNKAVRNGGWRSRVEDAPGRREKLSLFGYLRKHRPGKIGFQCPSWISPFVSLSEPAAAFLKARRDKSKLRDFMNGYKAEPWVDYQVERTEDAILALRDDRPRGLVPGGGIITGLTAAVDTQDDGFYYEIRAWAYGLTQESWQIREGFAPTFAALEQILFADQYPDAQGNAYIVHLAVIDAMGHRTAEVYDWTRLHRGRILPLKGEQRMNQPFAYSTLDCYPGTNKPIPGGLRLLRGNVTYYKNDLSGKLQIAPADPGAWHLHSETSRDWATQMTAEYLDEKGLWECPQGKANHAWDVSVYNLIAADVLGIKYWAKLGIKGQEPSESRPKTIRSRRW